MLLVCCSKTYPKFFEQIFTENDLQFQFSYCLRDLTAIPRCSCFCGDLHPGQESSLSNIATCLISCGEKAVSTVSTMYLSKSIMSTEMQWEVCVLCIRFILALNFSSQRNQAGSDLQMSITLYYSQEKKDLFIMFTIYLQ